jgi:hypothetical protein
MGDEGDMVLFGSGVYTGVHFEEASLDPMVGYFKFVWGYLLN